MPTISGDCLMTKKELHDLVSRPTRPDDLDELESIAKAHEDMAYRYRSAVSLLRWRMQREQQDLQH